MHHLKHTGTMKKTHKCKSKSKQHKSSCLIGLYQVKLSGETPGKVTKHTEKVEPCPLVFKKGWSLTGGSASSLEGLVRGLRGGTRKHGRFFPKHHNHHLNQTVEVRLRL